MNTKVCTKCKLEKSLEFFSKQKRGKYGVTSICKSCISENGKKWHKENLEKSLAYKIEYAKKNKEKHSYIAKKWRLENKEREKNSRINWANENREKTRSYSARRRAQRIMASPKWANQLEIIKIYEKAKMMTNETEIMHEVDHIIPLISELVCGLHCEFNLQVLTVFENRSKGNKFSDACL